ncbi:MAG: carboxypeptidase-like regulatory domain-containing protein [Candidatus Poseidoniaceae archaeon]|nr:carboxypeptidase-like regulatory domain-containing protein [Candidatus Poseidoniaceae archaeon]
MALKSAQWNSEAFEMDINERRDALRARVRKKLDESDEPSEEDELVVQEQEIIMSATQNEELLVIEDKNGLLALASSLIFIGSVLGIITGLLLLQGNPTDLLGNTLEVDDVIDVRGIVLESESGESMDGVTIELLEIESKTILQTATTNSYGYYEFENVAPEPHTIRVTLDGYKIVERTISATNVNQDAFTLTIGEGVIQEDETTERSGWTLENAVALSTGIALATIVAGVFGLYSAVGARTQKRYRRTQYFAGVALLSRGFIVFGPFLILCGMGLMVLAKDEFDQPEVE